MIFKKNLMNFIIISIVFATILMSKKWASYRNDTKIKKVHYFGNEFIDNEFLNFFNNDIKNKDIYDLNINELSKVFENNHYIKAARVSKHFPDKIKIENCKIKAVIFDLGCSYTQIKDPKKGLSFESIGALNMRLGLNHFSCDDVISNISEKSLNKIFKLFGEEKNSKLIAKKIVKNRNKNKLKTEDLVNIAAEIKKYKFFK